MKAHSYTLAAPQKTAIVRRIQIGVVNDPNEKDRPWIFGATRDLFAYTEQAHPHLPCRSLFWGGVATSFLLFFFFFFFSLHAFVRGNGDHFWAFIIT